MHGVLDYVRTYLGPSLLSLHSCSFSPPTALCAKAPVGQQRGALACLPLWTGHEWVSAIALYGHIPILAVDFDL